MCFSFYQISFWYNSGKKIGGVFIQFKLELNNKFVQVLIKNLSLLCLLKKINILARKTVATNGRIK
jgi:hypothetical protein